jgi:hypothetical protein
MTSQQSPSRALDYPMSSSVPITGLAWDGVPEDHFRFKPVEVEKHPYAVSLSVAVCELDCLRLGVPLGLLIYAIAGAFVWLVLA